MPVFTPRIKRFGDKKKRRLIKKRVLGFSIEIAREQAQKKVEETSTANFLPSLLVTPQIDRKFLIRISNISCSLSQTTSKTSRSLIVFLVQGSLIVGIT